VCRKLFVFATLSVCLLAGGCFGPKKAKVVKSDSSVEPDKVLYERALNDIQHGRQEIGRLSLQTLINTYPDSDYLAKAKLSIADSYYKEGGSANFTQAIASYKDFIVFFPFDPQAAYAQMQVGMTYYRQMAKPDRDRSQAKGAEDEFQTFLQKYPESPLAPKAEQRLREVQEVLAEGDFRIGYYYYVKGTMASYRASASRLMEVSNRYPLYSKADQALWMLGNIFEKVGKGEQKEVAAQYYARIARNYPLSNLAPEAKKKLVALHAPIPQPDPQALAWMQKERSIDRGHASILHKATGILHGGPDVRTAARSGSPNMTPGGEASSAGDILRPGGTAAMGTGGPGNTAVIETVTPGTTSDTTPGASPSSSDNPGSSAPASGGASPAPNSGTPNPENPPAATNETKADPNAAGASPQTPSTATSDPASSNKASGDQTNSQQSGTPAPNGQDSDKKDESSSKKKKGLRKIIPW